MPDVPKRKYDSCLFQRSPEQNRRSAARFPGRSAFDLPCLRLHPQFLLYVTGNPADNRPLSGSDQPIPPDSECSIPSEIRMCQIPWTRQKRCLSRIRPAGKSLRQTYRCLPLLSVWIVALCYYASMPTPLFLLLHLLHIKPALCFRIPLLTAVLTAFFLHFLPLLFS